MDVDALVGGSRVEDGDMEVEVGDTMDEGVVVDMGSVVDGEEDGGTGLVVEDMVMEAAAVVVED